MIYASFRKPVGIFNNWMNRVAATVTGGNFCHSEFIFEWTEEQLTEALHVAGLSGSSLSRISCVDDKIHVAMYIMWGMQVGYRVLSYDAEDPFWNMPEQHLVPIPCDFKQEKKIFVWCMEQYGKDYDKMGALGSLVPVRSWQIEYDTYFCSQFMACALNHVYITSVNPGAVTPNSLYDTLTNHQTQ
tara:strand:+ start:1408 stop:1965 length:558 start_codon:yes stop_codon:yes gene_type:complete